MKLAKAAMRELVAEKVEQITLAGMAKAGAWEELAGMWCLAEDLGADLNHEEIATRLDEQSKPLAAEYRSRATKFASGAR